MIKITVMYAHREGARFDFDYYLRSHVPMVRKFLGTACVRCEVDRGIAPGASGQAPAYVAMAHFYCHSIEDFQSALEPHQPRIREDVANYTDLQPIRHFSEIHVCP